jgi:hypothetical protein
MATSLHDARQHRFALEEGEPPARRRRRRAAGLAPPHLAARAEGREDGLAGHRNRAGCWPSGVYGHGDYELGHAEGEAERWLMLEIRDGGAAA